MTTYQPSMGIDESEETPGVERVNLHYLLTLLIDGTLEIPEHQRDFVWEESKRDSYIEDVRLNRMSPQLFSMYSYKGRPGIWYLNDGSQRLRAIQYYYMNSERYADESQNAAVRLRGRHVAVDRKLYDCPEEAMEHFIKLQMGTNCTRYEQLKGIIAYLEGYKTVWKPLIERMNADIGALQNRATSRMKFNREDQHKQYRDNIAFFVRYALKDKSRQDYNPASKSELPWKKISAKQTLEHRFAAILTDWGQDKVENTLDGLIRLLTYRSATYDTAWEAHNSNPGIKPTLTHWRWVMTVAVWADNHKIEAGKFQDFVEKLFEYGNGETTLDPPDGKRLSLAMSKMGTLNKVCESIGSDLHLGKTKRKSQDHSLIREGYDVSHELPFSKNGEGDTIIEPSSANRSRGASPISD